eukprot:9477736-Pyramimonas_sp.AAC.1
MPGQWVPAKNYGFSALGPILEVPRTAVIADNSGVVPRWGQGASPVGCSHLLIMWPFGVFLFS